MMHKVLGSGALLTTLIAAAFVHGCSSDVQPPGGGGNGSMSSSTSSGFGGTTTSSSTSVTSSGAPPCGYFNGPCCANDVCYGTENMGLLGCIAGVCRGSVGYECTTNDDCVSNVCLPLGHCSAPCTGPNDCPPAPEWSCAALEGAATDMCQCQPSGQETCDGRDNNCNGRVDEGGTLDCPPGHLCSIGGVCACIWTVCGGVCTDTKSDPANCGACGSACASGEVCEAGNCLTALVKAEYNIAGLAIDATHAYWTNHTTGTIMKVPITGGVPMTLTSGQTQPTDIVVDGTHAYWLNQDSVMKVPIAGGAATVLASGQSYPHSIAVNATHVFWTNNDDQSVKKVGLGGGVATVVATFSNGYPAGIALDGTHVYWGNSDGSVLKVPLAGGTPSALATAPVGADGVAVDATHVYWTTSFALPSVYKVPLSGGAPTLLATVDLGGGNANGRIAVDATHVYWTVDTTPGFVMKISRNGGAPTTIASNQVNPYSIAVNATHVYWVSHDIVSSSIFKKPK